MFTQRFSFCKLTFTVLTYKSFQTMGGGQYVANTYRIIHFRCPVTKQALNTKVVFVRVCILLVKCIELHCKCIH